MGIMRKKRCNRCGKRAKWRNHNYCKSCWRILLQSSNN